MRSEEVFFVGDADHEQVYHDLNSLSVVEFLRKYLSCVQQKHIKDEEESYLWDHLFKFFEQEDEVGVARLLKETCHIYGVDRESADLREMMEGVATRFSAIDCHYACNLIRNKKKRRDGWITSAFFGILRERAFPMQEGGSPGVKN